MLFLRSEHPQRQHVRQHMPQPAVQERVSHQLPDITMHHGSGDEAEVVQQEGAKAKAGGNRPQYYLEKINPRTRNDDSFHPGREGRKTQRDGFSAIHKNQRIVVGD